MAKLLNRSRIRQTQLVLLIAGFCILFSRPMIVDESPLHELMDILGNLFIIACVLGRIYCTSFIGGKKNELLVMTGPFSVCRNPLYFSSFLGACGIGLMSSHVTLTLLLPALFCAVYFPLIHREEGYLKEHFGTEYLAYMQSTPRFFPKFNLYQSAESMTVNVRYLHKALKDSILWICAFPIFEAIEYAQHLNAVPALFILP